MHDQVRQARDWIGILACRERAIQIGNANLLLACDLMASDFSQGEILRNFWKRINDDSDAGPEARQLALHTGAMAVQPWHARSFLEGG